MVDTFNFQLCLVHFTVLWEQSGQQLGEHALFWSHSARTTSPPIQVFDVPDEQAPLVLALVLACFQATGALEDDEAFTVLRVLLEVDSLFE